MEFMYEAHIKVEAWIVVLFALSCSCVECQFLAISIANIVIRLIDYRGTSHFLLLSILKLVEPYSLSLSFFILQFKSDHV